VQLCVNHGFRCIAPDRRGFGKSDWDGPQSDAQITYETFAQDTVHLMEKFLDVGSFVFITSSMGAGESVLALEASDYLRKNCKVCTRFCTRLVSHLRTLLTKCRDSFGSPQHFQANYQEKITEAQDLRQSGMTSALGSKKPELTLFMLPSLESLLVLPGSLCPLRY
jgi:hypothetical protein